MSTKEYSAVVVDVAKMTLEEFPIPHIGPEEALLKVEIAGVCGSDPKMYHGRARDYFPLILGHEILGHIEEIGAEAAKRYGVRKGDRVVIEAIAGCGHCEYCVTGNYKFCEEGVFYGTRVSCKTPPHLWGAYGQYMYIAPNSLVHKIDKSVPAEAAVLANAVIANGIQWVRLQGQASIGDVVVIQGTGAQGLAGTIAARESGASLVIVTGLSRDAERLKLAKEFGADLCIDIEKEPVVERVAQATKGKMADVVLDVTGNPKGLLNSVELVKKQGIVVCAGIVGPQTATPLLTDKLVFKEVKLLGVFTSSFGAVEDAIRLVESRKYPLEKMVTHRFPLEKAEQAVKAVGGEVPGEYPIKAILIP